MKEITFVIGGCRSGKSNHALELAERIPGDKKIFIATCIPCDAEMEERVVQHQRERDKSWKTIEIPIHLPQTVLENSRTADVVLVDCLTFWMSNLLLELEDNEKIIRHIEKLTKSLEDAECSVVLVSNEVGAGIVPENELARRFRDIVGKTNQMVATCADKVIWMVASVPSAIKDKNKNCFENTPGSRTTMR